MPMPKVLLTQVTEPQICFPVEDGSTICNWVKQGLFAVSSKNGWMRIPPPPSFDPEDEEETAVEIEEAPSLTASRASSGN